MHATFDRSMEPERNALFFAELPDPSHDRMPIVPTAAASSYAASHGLSWPTIIAIAALHAAAIVALVKLDVIAIARPAPPPLVVNLISEPAPPPIIERPKAQPETDQKIETPIVTPLQIVQTVAAPPPPITVTTTPPPPRPLPVATAPAAPVTVDNLDERMIEGKPPRYPMESRRKREQGTVLLRLLIGLDGRVAQASVAESSGFDRLDQAALQAVRGWRWQPMVRDGTTVEVRGVMPIPFVLKT